MKKFKQRKAKIKIQGTPLNPPPGFNNTEALLILLQFMKCHLHKSLRLVSLFPVSHSGPFRAGIPFPFCQTMCTFLKWSMRGKLVGPQSCVCSFGWGKNSRFKFIVSLRTLKTSLFCLPAYSIVGKRSDANLSLGPLFPETLEADLYPQRSETSPVCA